MIFFSLSYCINIGFYLLLKAKKLSARDHPVMERLVQYQKVCFVATAGKGLKETGRFVTNLSYSLFTVAYFLFRDRQARVLN